MTTANGPYTDLARRKRKEQKPGFVFSTVLPSTNFGKILVKGQPAINGNWVTSRFNESTEALENSSPQWFVDVQDNARIHIAALNNAEVQNERILAYVEPYNGNDILRALQKLRPDHTRPEDFIDDKIRDYSKVANQRGEELLKKYFGRLGWTTLTESMELNIEDL